MSDPTPTPEATAQTLDVSAAPDKPRFIWGVGRRKTSTARVRIAPGSGRVRVKRAGHEERELNDYFPNERDRKAIFGPLEVSNTGGKLDVIVTASGGGLTGQAGAIVLGLARALYQGFELADAFGPLRLIDGQVPVKSESLAVKTRSHQRKNDGARPGERAHGDAPPVRFGDKHRTRVGDGRATDFLRGPAFVSGHTDPLPGLALRSRSLT